MRPQRPHHHAQSGRSWLPRFSSGVFCELPSARCDERRAWGHWGFTVRLLDRKQIGMASLRGHRGSQEASQAKGRRPRASPLQRGPSALALFVTRFLVHQAPPIPAQGRFLRDLIWQPRPPRTPEPLTSAKEADLQPSIPCQPVADGPWQQAAQRRSARAADQCAPQRACALAVTAARQRGNRSHSSSSGAAAAAAAAWRRCRAAAAAPAARSRCAAARQQRQHRSGQAPQRSSSSSRSSRRPAMSCTTPPTTKTTRRSSTSCAYLNAREADAALSCLLPCLLLQPFPLQQHSR